jgi:hypothetical protein
MSPVVRIWSIAAAGAALLLALRGAWPLALLCFLLSPAPAWALARGPAERAQAASGWLRAIATIAVILVVATLAVIAAGGIPPVHEWRGALAPAAR